MKIGNKILITGGLGFIGSYFAEKLSIDSEIIILDNFSGYSKVAESFLKNLESVKIVDFDITKDNFDEFLRDVKTVFHFAANSDISNGVNDPEIDFNVTTLGTYRLLVSMKKNNVKNLIFPSGSGVYGDFKEGILYEDHGPLSPVSYYGASKLSAEASISAFCQMTDINALVFRFANVVGYRQTHGVVFDLINKLRVNKDSLKVLGDGHQSKSYIDVEDIYNAIILAAAKTNSKYDVFNLATSDYITVSEIVSLILNDLELFDTQVLYGKEKFGWKGDVPIVRFSTKKIQSYGWKNNYSSKEAIERSIKLIRNDNF